MARVGDTINSKYLLTGSIGLGGMGEVFAAEDLWTGRRVAIKALRAEHLHDPHAVERFWHEARCAVAIRHPNIVDVLEVGLEEVTREPFLVMEHLEGTNLERLLAGRPDRRLPTVEALLAVLPVMDALCSLHAAGLIHRDVKPSNLFLARAPDGDIAPKLLDFGVSKSLVRRGPVFTATGAAVGTPQYMAPEQARGDVDVDARADVWAVGATLFEAIAGRLPFEGPSVHVIVAQILHADAPPLRSVAPEAPVAVASAIDRALRRDPRERYASMREFVLALLRCDETRAQVFAAAPQLSRRSLTGAEAATVDDVPRAPPPRGAAATAAASSHTDAARNRVVAATAALTFTFVVALSALQRDATSPARASATLTPPARTAAPAPRPPPAEPAVASEALPSAPPPASASDTARRPPRRPARPRRAVNAPSDPLTPDERPYAVVARRRTP